MAIAASGSGAHTDFGRGTSPWLAAAASALCSVAVWLNVFLTVIFAGVALGSAGLPITTWRLDNLQIFLLGLGLVAIIIGTVAVGHLGDRFGRRLALATSLAISAWATLCMVVAPTSGDPSTFVFTVIVMAQGVALGGVWTGTVLRSMESAPRNDQRGFFASLPPIGMPIGLSLAYGVVYWSWSFLGDQFLAWGWRALCLSSALLTLVPLFLQFRLIPEARAFEDVHRGLTLNRLPVAEALQSHALDIVLAALLRVAELLPVSVVAGVIFASSGGVHAWQKSGLVAAVVAGCAATACLVPFSGLLANWIGQLATYLIGAGLAVMGALLAAAGYEHSVLTLALSVTGLGLLIGPQAGLIAQSFPTRVRYTASSLSYHLGAVGAAGVLWLAARRGDWDITPDYRIIADVLFLVLTGRVIAGIRQSASKKPDGLSYYLDTTKERIIILARDGIETITGLKGELKKLWTATAVGVQEPSAGADLKEPPQRSLNAWIDNSNPRVGQPFHVFVNIGEVQAAASAPFTEPDWGAAISMKLLVSLSSLDSTVDPPWGELELPRTGESPTISFTVTLDAPRRHNFSIRVYMAKEMILLQSLSFVVEAAEQRQPVGI